MKKLCLMSCALALALVVSFVVGNISREHPVVEGLSLNFTKVTFHVAIDGIEGELPVGVRGLGAECEVVETLDPKTGETKKRPGRVKYGDITLKRGLLSEAKVESLYPWYADVKRGALEKKAGAIIVRDRAGSEVTRYSFYEGWPCKWRGVRAPNAEAAFPSEDVDLVVQKVQKVR